MLDHQGRKDASFDETATVFAEVDRLRSIIEPTRFVATTALLYSEACGWAWDMASAGPFAGMLGRGDTSTQGRVLEWYQPLYAAKVSVDILDPLRDLSGYKVVFCPNLYLIRPDIVGNLKRYVADGGTLIMGPKAGLKDWSNTFFTDIPPCGGLSEMLGATVKTSPLHFGMTRSPARSVKMAHAAPFAGGQSFENIGLFDYLEPTTAKPLAQHNSGDAAITLNHFGKGRAIYLGCMLEEAFHPALIEWLESEGLLEPAFQTDADVEVTVRAGGGHRLTFILNHNQTPAEIVLDREYDELIAEERVSGLLVVAGGEVAILCETC